MALSASFALSSLAVLAGSWFVVILVIGAVLLLSLASGLALARFGGLDRATAALGTLPGAAPSMVAMSADLQADARIVAFMQYVRLIVVVLTASLLVRFVFSPVAPLTPVPTGAMAGERATIDGAGVLSISTQWAEWAVSAAVAALGAWGGLKLRLPAGALIGPTILGVALGLLGIPHGSWPPSVREVAFALIGVRVGGLFDPAAIRLVARVAPVTLGFVLALMAACGLLGWGLANATGMDPLTAYLATTPGGIESVTIAALDTDADTSLVLTIQMIRLLVIVLLGPPLVVRLTPGRWGKRVEGRANSKP